MHRFSLHRTRSGMPIGILHASRFKRALVQLFVRAGSRFETVANSGSTHLLEHVLFRGTERHPSRDALEDAFHRSGVDANAYTEREWVSIHTTTPAAHALDAVGLACEIGFRPRFKDVEIERSIVDAEIRESRTSDGIAHERIGKLLWGNHPLGFPVAGRRSPRTSPQGLRALHRRFFRPGNSFLMVAGNVDPAAVQRKVRSALRDLDAGTPHLPPPPPARSGPRLRFGVDRSGDLRLVFHFQADHGLEERDRLLLWVAGRLLEVRLSRVVREDRGACYDLFLDDEFGHALNAISINAMVRKSAGPMVVEEIFRQFRAIADGEGDPKDIETVRAGMMRSYELLEDDIHDLTDFYARQMLLAPEYPPIRPAAARRGAARLDAGAIAEAATRLLGPRNLSLVLLADWNKGDRPRWRRRVDRLIGDYT